MSRPTLAPAALLLALAAGCAPVPLPREGAYQPSDATVSVMRIAHGSLVVGLRGARLAVDPWFHSGLIHRQSEPLGLRPEALPPTAAVVLTEAGPEALDEEALREIAKGVPRAVAPAPLAERLAALGFVDVRGLGPWQRTTFDGLDVTAVPSSGGDARLGWIVAEGDTRVYLAGDTAPFDGVADIATAFPAIDVAFVPIGGRRVLGVLRDLSPEQAAELVATLRPRVVVPTHYGSQGFFPFVWHAGDAVGRFRDALAERGLADRLVVLAPGESWHRF